MQHFETYLIEIEPQLRDEMQANNIIKEICPDYVISFNYTDTIESLYGVDPDKICYIHGRIEKNNIVFGYNDEDGAVTDLMFKKYYRRL